MKKIFAIGAILAVAALLVSTFAFALTGNAINIFNKEEGISETDDAISNTAINSVDVYEVEQEIEIETEGLVPGDIYKSRKMLRVHGFVYNDELKLAALINGMFLKGTVYSSEDSVVKSLVKGKLKIAENTFDVERSDSGDEDLGVFNLKGSNGETGVLSVKLDKTYNEGRLKVWKGTLSINGKEVSYKGDVVLYTQEKLLRPEPKKPVVVKPSEPGVITKNSYSGFFSVDSLNFKFESAGNPEAKQIDSYVFGENNVEGKMSLKLVEYNKDDTLRTYNGKIFVQEVGDDDDRLEGSVVVTIQRDSNSNEWSGRIVINDKAIGQERAGDFMMYEEKTQISRSSKSSSVGIPEYRDDKEKADTFTDSKVKEKGFFDRIYEKIFG